MRLCLLARNFFAFSPSNIKNIRQKICYLVKWGFSYSDVKNIPIDEIDDFVGIINEYYEAKAKAERGEPQDSSGSDNPKMSGSVNPTAF